MLQHHIQKTIVYSLAHADGLRFSELKPAEIENKLFDYHLKIVIKDGLAVKHDDGKYALTPEGRRIWLRSSQSDDWFAEAAYSVLFLAIRNKADGKLLLARRKTHPLFDMTGFLHAAPVHSEDIGQTASRVTKQRTGLDATFQYCGSGYLRMYNQDSLESYTHFNMLASEDAHGELVAEDDSAVFSWVDAAKIDELKLIPNMSTLLELYSAGEQFFVEKTIRY